MTTCEEPGCSVLASYQVRDDAGQVELVCAGHLNGVLLRWPMPHGALVTQPLGDEA